MDALDASDHPSTRRRGGRNAPDILDHPQRQPWGNVTPWTRWITTRDRTPGRKNRWILATYFCLLKINV
jgi:hypothetical protein